MKSPIILIFICCVLTTVSTNATQYTWTGSVDTIWTRAGNWSPSGIPAAPDTARIVTGSNTCYLTANTTVSKFSITSGTLKMQAYTLTVTGAASFSSGTIWGTATQALLPSGSVASFTGTTFNVEVKAVCGQVILSGSTFSDTSYFSMNGSSTGTGQGGNTFNALATFVNLSTSVYFNLAEASSNTFNADIILINKGYGINASQQGAALNGNVYVNSKGGSGGVSFGSTLLSSGSSSTLASGKLIAVGDTGFSSGTLTLHDFVQSGTTDQRIQLSDSAVLNLIGAQFNADVEISAPSVAFKTCTFALTASITQTGTVATNSDGGNTFTGNATITNTGTGNMRPSFTTGDNYLADIEFISTSSGKLRPFYAGTSTIQGNLTITGSNTEPGTGTGKVKFSGSAEQVIDGERTVDFYKLTIDKSAGSVTCDTSVTVADTLKFMKGNLVTTSVHLLTMNSGSKAIDASDSSLVAGPVKKIGSTAFTFPTGKDSSYRAIEISAPSSGTDAYTAEYFNYSQTTGFDRDSSLTFISYCNYWNLTRTTGSSNTYVYLHWNANACGVGDTAGLKVSRWLTSKWKDMGHGPITGDYASGKMRTSSTVSSYGDFLLAYEVQYNTSYNDSDTTSIYIAWKDTLGGSSDDFGYSVKETLDGNYVIAGSTESYGAGNKDLYLLKLNTDGDTLWTKTYGGAGEEEAFSVSTCRDSGFVMAGYTETYGHGAKDIYIVKVNKSGTQQWTKTYGGGNDETAQCIVELNDSTLLLTGYTQSAGAGGKDIFMMRLEYDGDSLWKYTYGGGEDDIGYSILASNEGFILSGSTESYGAGNEDVYVIKTDSSGSTDWTETYGGSGTDIAYGMAKCTKGDWLLTGTTEAYGANGIDALLLKIKIDGDTVFTHVYGGDDDESFYGIAEVTDGSIMLCGYSNSYGNGSTDTWVVRTDNWGDELAHRLEKANGDDEARSVMVTPSDTCIVAGHSKSSAPASFNIKDIAIPLGCPVWRPRQLWCSNMWCANIGNCSLCPNNTLNLLDSPLPNPLGGGITPLQDFLNYCYLMKIRTVLIRTAATLMFDDEVDPVLGTPVSYDGVYNTTTGDPRRSKLSKFINILKTSGHVDRVILQLRFMAKDECFPGGRNDYTNVMMDLTKDFNDEPNTTDYPGDFDGVMIDYEYSNDFYGNGTPYQYIYDGWGKNLDVLDHCKTQASGTDLTVGLHYPGHTIPNSGFSVSGEDQADAIMITNGPPDEIYFEMLNADKTAYPQCLDQNWPNYWYDDQGLLVGDDNFEKMMDWFGTYSPPALAVPILHTNEGQNGPMLQNYMSGNFPCFTNEHEVYVPEVENDWVSQYLAYRGDRRANFNSNWEVLLGDISWFRYDLDPIAYPPRPGDTQYNYYLAHCNLQLRTSNSIQEVNSNSATGKSENVVRINPNPFKNEVEISFNNYISTSIEEIRIFEITGRDVTDKFQIEKNRQTIKLKCNEITLQYGIYFCKVQSSDQTSLYKLVKTE